MPDKLLFRVGKSEQNHIYFTICFACFSVLLELDDSGASAFMAAINEFTKEDFYALYRRIKALDKRTVRMNETNVIITVAVLHYVCLTYLDENEENALRNCYEGDWFDEFMSMRDKVLSFGSFIIRYLKINLPDGLLRYTRVMKWLET